MQAFALWRLPLLAAFWAAGDCRLAVRVGVDDAAVSYRSELANLGEVESDDRRFWTAEFDNLESQLERLQGAAATAEEVANATASNATKKQKGTGALATEKHHSPLAGLKLNLNPKSVADLVPALAMLKGLYEDGKDRIAKLNVREKKYKQQFADKEAEHNRRLVRIEARFKNHTLSAEFRTNETRDETRMWTYWQRVRERQHRQFHTSLKIQHGTMERVKTMMDMYEKTINGQGKDKAQVKKQLSRVSQGAMPDIVFLQGDVRAAWHEMHGFCGRALSELRAARLEAAAAAPLAPAGRS
jgi:hypothetical protein